MAIANIAGTAVVQKRLELLASRVLLYIRWQNSTYSTSMPTHFQMLQLVVDLIELVFVSTETLRNVRGERIAGKGQAGRKGQMSALLLWQRGGTLFRITMEAFLVSLDGMEQKQQVRRNS